MARKTKDLAVWKLRRLLRRAENLTWTQVSTLSKADCLERCKQYQIHNTHQSCFALQIGSGPDTWDHITLVPTIVSVRKSKGLR